MTHATLTLRRFDRMAEEEFTAPPSAAATWRGLTFGMPPLEADPVIVDEPEEEAPAPAPEPSPPDPLERIAETLEALSARMHRERSAAEAAAAAAFAEAARTAFPLLARRAFPAELADAALRLARAAPGRRIVLRLAPEDLDPVALVLDERAEGLDLLMEADPGCPPGRADLHWQDGGAELDGRRLLAEAEALLAPEPADPGPAANHDLQELSA